MREAHEGVHQGELAGMIEPQSRKAFPCRGNGRFGFLKNCALVVIDKSHHAITTSYTRLLDGLVPEEPADEC